jgi:predicted glycoside hydrolase/deacetylase ChbG (UPF0249 family)
MRREFSPASILLFFPLAFFSMDFSRAETKNHAERLGHPADSKLLIIHADDLGVAHSVNRASFEALDRGAANSASAMVPTPWFSEVAEYARKNPDHDIGLHLTLTAEWKYYKWGPVSLKREIPGLLDPWGYFFPDVASVVKSATPDEVEREIRAQVELSIKMGLKPTHLDSHMGTLFANPAFLSAYVRVAKDYGIPYFAPRVVNMPDDLLAALGLKPLLLDGFAMAGSGVEPEEWPQFYANVVRTLKPGVTQLIVHLGYDDAELQAVTVDHPDFGSAWRQRDFEVITSPEFKKALVDNNVILIGWKDLKKLL